VLEAVPNVSEGRDATSIAAIGAAFATHSRLLDVHSDADHHRSVFTLVGDDDALVGSLVAGAARAVELVDLRAHDGIHPRVGAIDVVPLVALDPSRRSAADGAALATAERIGAEVGVPVLLYGRVAGGRRPAFFRTGGLHELVARIESGELVPDAGPRDVDPRSGVALVGSRDPLVAYNLELDRDELAIAREIARAIRESSGGLPGVQAIGLRLPRVGRIQVSMNLVDINATPLHEVVRRVEGEARARGARVTGGELVGLVPERVLEDAERAGVELPGIDASRALERALAQASF
jgi:glutamate formiminotransferase/glutamate formiminotransferase/formiminotetrahydrofolate cyclodeaminase